MINNSYPPNETACIFCNGTGVQTKSVEGKATETKCSVCNGRTKITAKQLEEAILAGTDTPTVTSKKDIPWKDIVKDLVEEENKEKTNVVTVNNLLLKCIIPLEVLYVTHLDKPYLSNKLKTAIRESVEAFRKEDIHEQINQRNS